MNSRERAKWRKRKVIELNELIVPGIVFVFALVFFMTSLQTQCWYRRYLFPVMFVLLGLVFIEEFIVFLLFILAAVLTYFGFRGYGREKLKEEKEGKENEDSG